MRTDPITKEKFEPKNPNHYFSSDKSFATFIEEQDPMEEFVPEKREINWEPIERVDPNTGEKFIATHPAQIYAPKAEDEADFEDEDEDQNEDG